VINNIEERWNEATEAWVLRAATETRAKKEANSYSKLRRDDERWDTGSSK
jgi:hypothetical protein